MMILSKPSFELIKHRLRIYLVLQLAYGFVPLKYLSNSVYNRHSNICQC